MSTNRARTLLYETEVVGKSVAQKKSGLRYASNTRSERQADGSGGATGERERRGTTTDTDYAFPTNLVETPIWCDNF